MEEKLISYLSMIRSDIVTLTNLVEEIRINSLGSKELVKTIQKLEREKTAIELQNTINKLQEELDEISGY